MQKDSYAICIKQYDTIDINIIIMSTVLDLDKFMTIDTEMILFDVFDYAEANECFEFLNKYYKNKSIEEIKDFHAIMPFKSISVKSTNLSDISID